jgi:membrane-associated protease RseP (regulator of RpoE activity)
MPEPQWKAMFDAQCAWDATMAYNAVQALRKHGDGNTVMVVLIGSGHVAYGLGIQRQAARWYDGRMASLVPVPVLDEKQRPVGKVQASYADFLWGLPHEQDPLYPELGISTGDIPGERKRKVLSVDAESVGKAAGFRVGDVLLSMDGTPIEDREVLNRLLSEKKWGDAASFVVRRGEGEARLEVQFRRTLPTNPAGLRQDERR